MNITQINTAIMFGDFTNDQLTSIIDAVKFARAQLTKQNRRALDLGDTVQFRDSRRGMLVRGTVQKIAIKFVTVRTTNGLWKVPASMLELVLDEAVVA
jgi:hypothetical protein